MQSPAGDLEDWQVPRVCMLYVTAHGHVAGPTIAASTGEPQTYVKGPAKLATRPRFPLLLHIATCLSFAGSHAWPLRTPAPSLTSRRAFDSPVRPNKREGLLWRRNETIKRGPDEAGRGEDAFSRAGDVTVLPMPIRARDRRK